MFKERFVALVIFIISVIGILLMYGQHGSVPGDIGDGRFNLYVLEHFSRVLQGQDSSFVTAPFFYPWTKTISFSDTYWGTGLIYALFRTKLFNFPPEKAYVYWYYAGYLLNYGAAYFVSRKLGLRALGASIAAFMFTFSLPMLWQDGHPQLVYRLYVPLAFFTLHRYLRDRNPIFLALTALFVALQFLATLYIGMFLVFFLAAYLVIWRYASPQYKEDKLAADASLQQFKSEKKYCSLWCWAGFIVAFALAGFLLFAIPYFEVQQLYGFNRHWGEIALGLPRIQSYFMAEQSAFWFSKTLMAFNGVTSVNEQQLFIGVGGLILVLHAIFSKNFLREHPLSRQMLYTAALLIVITLSVGDVTFYQILSVLPGITSIRAVCRIILVLIFPLGIVIGQVIDHLNSKQATHFNMKPLVFILCAVIFMDSLLASKHISHMKDWDAELQTFSQKITTPVNKDSIIVAAMTNPPYVGDLDAMLYAQMNGVKTMNGYSGNQPPGYQYLQTCADVDKAIKKAEIFYQKKLHQNFKIERKNIIYIGFKSNCHKVNG